MQIINMYIFKFIPSTLWNLFLPISVSQISLGCYSKMNRTASLGLCMLEIITHVHSTKPFDDIPLLPCGLSYCAHSIRARAGKSPSLTANALEKGKLYKMVCECSPLSTSQGFHFCAALLLFFVFLLIFTMIDFQFPNKQKIYPPLNTEFNK